ncbi:DUF2852 domain-containing protein [Pseudoprimorskyibacter insulae]|uniref:DUF2852 domain-containing protein n=1 Tax=Pseudoprimorskyibacter insulae TaxID=1695997 RepID=A0A2R8AXE3_9RHOB|nr:DUF2852 domain-containing protein [Pseudoprimorskyibacter insulae]SPF80693.1 hypothetical protein PRI8871_02504 [Pseudoprimorskyibacter insulae]
MTTAASSTPLPANSGWFSRSEAWLDSKGKGAWIAAMVLGFVFFWPVGLALLFYMIWSKRMFSKSCRGRGAASHFQNFQGFHAMKPSGNTAFDAYKADTLRRLMDEQEQFEAFLERLRAAKDKAEFDQFMDDRAKTAQAARDDEEDARENA